MNSTTVTPTLGTLVRACRKAEGLTQAALAQAAGVGVRFVRELEADKPTLRLDKVEQVLWLFGYRVGAVPLEEHPPADA